MSSLTNENQKVPELTLIFRASDNLFKAKEFHIQCDNYSNTLTLVKSYYGKIFGGFTPLKWNKIKGYDVDSLKKGFIFSVDMKLKMNLAKSEYSIQYDKNSGPIFGKEC